MPKGILNNTIWSLSARLFTVVVKVIAVIFLARFLGPSEFGIFTLIISTVALFSVFVDLGISPATARLLAQDKWNSKHAILLSSKLLFLTFTLFALIIYFFGDFFFGLINAVKLNELLLIFVVLILLQTFQKFYQKCFEGLRRVDLSSKVSLLFEWSPWGFAILSVALLGPTAKNAIIGKIAGSGLLLVGFVFFMWFVILKKQSISTNSKIQLGTLLKYSAPMLVTAVSFFVYTHSDILIIQALVGEAEVGIYGVAVRMLDTLHVPAAAIGSAIGAYFVTIYQDKSGKDSNLFYDATKWILIIYLPLSVGLVVTSFDLFPLVFGIEYGQAGIIAIIYAPSLLLKSLSATYSLALDYMGYASKRAVAISISAILNIGLNFLLIPKYGIIGAAFATQITYLPVVIWYIFLIKRVTNSSLRILLKELKPIILSSLIMGLVIFATSYLFNIHVLISVLIGISIYVFAGWKLKILSNTDIKKIKQKLKKAN